MFSRSLVKTVDQFIMRLMMVIVINTIYLMTMICQKIQMISKLLTSTVWM